MFACTLIDPPWPESGGGRIVRGAQKHYSLMKPPEIHEVIRACPLWMPDPNSHLWLWVTSNHLKSGLWLMDALGFRYIKDFPWVKIMPTHLPDMSLAYIPQKPGLGQYAGGQHELLLFGVRGKLPAMWKDCTTGAKRPGSVIMGPRREHSRKPIEQFDTIENISPGPRAELFARESRPGWMAWGDELGQLNATD